MYIIESFRDFRSRQSFQLRKTDHYSEFAEKLLQDANRLKTKIRRVTGQEDEEANRIANANRNISNVFYNHKVCPIVSDISS